MPDQKNLLQTQRLCESIYMFSIPSNLVLPVTFRFAMAGKFDDNRVKLLLKKALLIAPCVLSTPGSMDEENGFSPL